MVSVFKDPPLRQDVLQTRRVVGVRRARLTGSRTGSGLEAGAVVLLRGSHEGSCLADGWEEGLVLRGGGCRTGVDLTGDPVQEDLGHKVVGQLQGMKRGKGGQMEDTIPI